MTARSDQRKDAYHYILQILSDLTASDNAENWQACVPLEDLRLVKEGIADPSPSLVALLKRMFCNTLSESEIDSHLVVPFQQQSPE
jgi:hypothetical protein